MSERLQLDLVIIRHGQTDWNVAGRWQGHTDIPLNDNGKIQAQKIGQRLKSWPIAAIISSDLKRTAATAQAIAAPLGMTPSYTEAWRERNVGEMAGLTRQQIREQYPDVYEDLGRGVFRPIGGESGEELQKRAVTAYEEIVQTYTNGETIVVVSHGGTISTLVCHILNLPLENGRYFSLRGNTGLTRIQVFQTGARLITLNDTGHLE